jgi:transcriptional regulator with XRE-family HTH domain
MYEIYQRLLTEKGLKNSDVARATGISNMTLSDWKRGISKPKEDKMRKIAEFLGVNYSYLMGYEDTVQNINMDFLMDISFDSEIQDMISIIVEMKRTDAKKFENLKSYMDFLKVEHN